jgi:hypothetical protein
MGASFMPGVRDDPSKIISILKMMKENIESGRMDPLQEPMNNQMERMLSLDPEKDGETIMAIYKNDFLDEFITRGIDYPM